MDFILAMFASVGPEKVEQWMLAGGYVFFFAILFISGLGVPIPEDVPLIAAGALIANDKMEWVPVAFVAWCGIIGGDMVLYHLGKKFGPNITKVRYVGKHINIARLGQIESLFAKYGFWVVFVGRMFAGVRGVMVVTAGTIGYSRVKFIVADGIAAIVSGGLFVFLGYWLGQNLPALMKKVDTGKGILMGIVLVALVGAGIWWWLKRRKRRRGTQVVAPPASAPKSTTTSTNAIALDQ